MVGGTICKGGESRFVSDPPRDERIGAAPGTTSGGRPLIV